MATTYTAQPAQGHKWWTLTAMCFGIFIALIDVTIVNVALPTIQHDLHASFSDLQWVSNAYVLAMAVLIVTAGRLGDIFGRKAMFMTGIAIFVIGSLCCGLSGSISIGSLSHATILHLARAIQGLGGAFIFPLSLAIISVTFHGKERGAAIGIWGGLGGLATAPHPARRVGPAPCWWAASSSTKSTGNGSSSSTSPSASSESPSAGGPSGNRATRKPPEPSTSSASSPSPSPSSASSSPSSKATTPTKAGPPATSSPSSRSSS